MNKLTEEQKIQILTRSTLNNYSTDKTIEIIYNKLFGNSEYDVFICLSQEEIQEIRNLITQYETVNFIGKLL